MRIIAFFLLLFILACNSKVENKQAVNNDSISVQKPVEKEPVPIDPRVTKKDTGSSKEYSNARFRKVTVQRMEGNSFRVRGQGQIFEASFNWVIEDGHNEIAKGYQMTDAGAPEWGNFDFTVKASKKRANSTLHIILFEASAKDGSRQHELQMVLY